MDLTSEMGPEQVAQLHQSVALLHEEIEYLREQIRLLKAKLFGPKTDRFPDIDNQQIQMFDEPDPKSELPEDDDEGTEISAHKRKKPGRKPLPEDLPREHVYHDLCDADKMCGCGTSMVKIGEETSEKLDIEPAKAKVIRHHRNKYACPSCEGVETEGGTVKIAPMPPQLIPKSFATPGLLAHVLTAKFVDGLPFYRQEQQMKRMKIPLKRATMCNWSVKMGEKCQRIIEILLEKAKQGRYLHCDETTVQVMNEPGRKNTSKSYMWVIRRGPPDTPLIIFHYNPSRSKEVAKALLSDYRGFVQTDGYKSYNFLAKQKGVTLLACMAHARRKFADVCKAQGKTSRKKGLAGEGLIYFKKLYRIEREAREESLSFEEIKALRQKESAPILEAFKSWLDEKQPIVPPKSLIGVAINYTLNLWTRLVGYLEEGFLQIDNNPVENSIRPFVIGRRNWLFSGSPEGATASATLYSLVITAKANGWDPYQYLRQLFQGLLTAETDQDYEILLPICTPPTAKMPI